MKKKVSDDQSAADVDSQDKQAVATHMPWFFKFMDMDDSRYFAGAVAFRLFQAIFLTANMAHPDEYWQVTQVAYRTVYGDPANGYDIDLPWEYHNDYRLRNTIYPLFHAGPMWVLKVLGLDSNQAIRLCPYIVHASLVIIGDIYLWKIGKSTVGKEATMTALLFYFTNRVQNSLIVRCFTNSLEEILTIVGFYFYQRQGNKFTKDTAIFTALVSIQFMMRNTSPIGWLPLLALKVFRDGAFVPFLTSGVIVALPILFLATYLDSVFYSMD